MCQGHTWPSEEQSVFAHDDDPLQTHLCTCCLWMQRHIASNARDALHIARKGRLLQQRHPTSLQQPAAACVIVSPDPECRMQIHKCGKQQTVQAQTADCTGCTWIWGTPAAWKACTCQRQGSTSPCTKCAIAAPDLRGLHQLCGL